MGKKLKDEQTKLKTAETIEKNHGRIETRKCWVSTDIEWLDQKENWRYKMPDQGRKRTSNKGEVIDRGTLLHK